VSWRRLVFLGAGLGLGLGLSLSAMAQTPPVETVPATPVSPAPQDVNAAGTLLERTGPGAAGGEDADQRSVTWQLRIEAPDNLRVLLARYLDLARFQPMAASERITRVELARLLAATPQQARGLLETLGYFNARITPQTSGGELDRAAGAAPGDANRSVELQITLKVEPGPLTTVGQVRLEIEGPLSEMGDTGDAASRALIERMRAGWTLPAGQPYTQSAWSSAKAAVLVAARAEGFALAALSGSVAQVDAPANRADLFVVLDSGPLFRFGELKFEGLNHVKPDALQALVNFTPGEPMREQLLLDYQDRLVKSSLFDTVAVLFEPDVDRAGAMPVTVRVHELARQQATFGVGASDTTGPRFTLEHLHQRIFDQPWQAKSRLQLGRDTQSMSVDLTSHPLPGPYRNLASGAIDRTEASGLLISSQRLRLGRTQDTERVERLYFVEWQHALTRNVADASVTDDATAVTLNYHWIWRRLDDPILPTRGYSLSAETAVGRSFASIDNSGFFGRATGRLTGYWPLGQSWYGQARVQLGQVYARDAVAVPFTLLFRAGGDDSVRGYGYQTLGPTAASNGSAIGGRVIGTGSIEIARPFSSRLPAWWWGVFLDAGNAADRWDDFRPVYGYGLGLRWRSPVGPLRIDLAYADALRKVRLHFSVGVTF
jgi:translocation and assembly module TamA